MLQTHLRYYSILLLILYILYLSQTFVMLSIVIYHITSNMIDMLLDVFIIMCCYITFNIRKISPPYCYLCARSYCYDIVHYWCYQVVFFMTVLLMISRFFVHCYVFHHFALTVKVVSLNFITNFTIVVYSSLYKYIDDHCLMHYYIIVLCILTVLFDIFSIVNIKN